MNRGSGESITHDLFTSHSSPIITCESPATLPYETQIFESSANVGVVGTKSSTLANMWQDSNISARELQEVMKSKCKTDWETEGLSCFESTSKNVPRSESYEHSSLSTDSALAIFLNPSPSGSSNLTADVSAMPGAVASTSSTAAPAVASGFSRESTGGGTSFHSVGGLQPAISGPGGILQHKCSHCSFSAIDYRSLKLHMKDHSGEKRFKCALCPYRAIHKGNLNTHMRKHSGQKPFKCNLCNYNSKHSVSLKGHMSTVHNMTYRRGVLVNVPARLSTLADFKSQSQQ